MPLLSEMTDEEVRSLLNKRRAARLTSPTPTETNFLARLAMGFARSPEDRVRIAETMGFGDTIISDPVGFDVGDIADFAGKAAPTFMSILGGVKAGPPGAGYGGAFGEAISQGIGRLMGAQGSDPLSTVIEGAGGALGEKWGAGVLNKALNPFRRATQTERIAKNVMEPAEHFGLIKRSPEGEVLRDVLPPASKTEQNLVARAQDRIESGSHRAGQQFREGPRETFRQAQQDAFENIAQSAGLSSRSPLRPFEEITEAAGKTLEAREAEIGQMFDAFRESLPDPSTIPVVKDATDAALRRMARRTQSATLPDANITASARAQIASLSEDVNKITNFEQLDAFRRKVGDTLRNDQQMEALRASGADADLRDIYGGLARDLRESLTEGQFARLFGQTGGRVTAPAVGTRGASRLEQRAPAARAQEVSFDNLASRIDAQEELLDTANEAFKEFLALEERSAVRLLKDPDRAQDIFARLFRRRGRVADIQAVRQKLGAEAIPGVQATTPEGQEAWKGLQEQLLREIRERSEDVFADVTSGALPFDGKVMRQVLDSLGGEEVLAETLGKQSADELYKFADFVRNADPTQRSFAKIQGASDISGGVSPTFTAIRMALASIFDRIAERGGFPGPSRMTRYLTEGMATSPEAQGWIRAIGNAGIQFPARVAGQMADPRVLHRPGQPGRNR